MTSPPVLTQPQPGVEEARTIHEFWAQNMEALRKKYPDRFVAVRNGEVVADDADLVLLVYRLRDLGLDPRTDVAIEFVWNEPANLLL